MQGNCLDLLLEQKPTSFLQRNRPQRLTHQLIKGSHISWWLSFMRGTLHFHKPPHQQCLLCLNATYRFEISQSFFVTDTTCCFVHSLHATTLNASWFYTRKVSEGNHWAKCNYCYVGFIWLKWPRQKKILLVWHILYNKCSSVSSTLIKEASFDFIFQFLAILIFLISGFVIYKLFLNGKWLPACFFTLFPTFLEFLVD